MSDKSVHRIELDHVSYSTQCDDIQQIGQLGLSLLREHATLSQFCTQGQQHIENHPDTGQRGGERATRLIGVND